MSDLQCAATLLIARDGEAVAGQDGAAGLSADGRVKARELARSLRSARVAMIYCSTAAPAVQTAEAIAAELGGVAVRTCDRLAPASPDDEADVLERVGDQLGEIVDLHRGETVLVLSHGDVISSAVPRLVQNVRSDFSRNRPLDHCAVAEVSADGDGWVLRSWGGQPIG